jgi:hypothetical protein
MYCWNYSTTVYRVAKLWRSCGCIRDPAPFQAAAGCGKSALLPPFSAAILCIYRRPVSYLVDYHRSYQSSMHLIHCTFTFPTCTNRFECALYYKLARLKVVGDTLSSRLSPQASLPQSHRETVVRIQNIALVSESRHVVHTLPG